MKTADGAPRGFLMSLEAAASLALIFISLAALPLFEIKVGTENDFFLCSDAAVALLKSGALSGASARQQINEAASLSGMCIEAGGASSCGYDGEGRLAFTFPIWRDGRVQPSTVSCWRQK